MSYEDIDHAGIPAQAPTDPCDAELVRLRAEVARLSGVCRQGAEHAAAITARLVELETERWKQGLELGALRKQLAHAYDRQRAAERRAELAEAHQHPAVAERLAELIDAGYHLWDVEASHGDGCASDETLAAARMRWSEAMIRYDTAREAAKKEAPDGGA